MPEELHTCPGCGRANFTARGLKAHRCRPVGSGVPPVTRDPSTGGAAAVLPSLSEAAVSARNAWAAVEESARQFDRATLADRLWIGVCCLVAQEHHAMDPKTRATKGGKAKAALSRRDKAGELSPDRPHPQGFGGWLAQSMPWLQRATAYKYLDAARGAGFTAWATEDEVRAWVSDRLEAEHDLSLRALIDAGRKLLPPPPENKDAGGPNWQQMTFDALLGFRDHCESIISHRDHMDPRQHEIACARAYRVLRELTGQPWAPADRDHDHYVAVLDDARAGGL